MAVPADRYRLSPRSMPEKLDVWEYDSDVAVRKVGCTKRISFRGQAIRIGGALLANTLGFGRRLRMVLLMCTSEIQKSKPSK